MKIYQLHEYSGCYEDFHDYIIGSYLKKERAEEEKVKAEAKEKELLMHSKKCNNCPFLDMDSLSKLDDTISLHPDYCSKMALEESEGDIYCGNYYCYFPDLDGATFEVREVEVEE